jgi:hypothetical protein
MRFYVELSCCLLNTMLLWETSISLAVCWYPPLARENGQVCVCVCVRARACTYIALIDFF